MTSYLNQKLNTLFIRKHWIFFMMDLGRVFLFFLLPVSFILVTRFFLISDNDLFFGIDFQYVSSVLVYLWTFISFLVLTDRFTKYGLTRYVINEDGIKETQLPALFSYRTKSITLQNIEKIEVTQDGKSNEFFSYGDLNFFNSLGDEILTFKKVEFPYELKSYIQELLETVKSKVEPVTTDEFLGNNFKIIEEKIEVAKANVSNLETVSANLETNQENNKIEIENKLEIKTLNKEIKEKVKNEIKASEAKKAEVSKDGYENAYIGIEETKVIESNSYPDYFWAKKD